MRRPPYLPFLAGPPEFVVGLKPIEPAAWLAPDTEHAWLPEKRRLMAERAVDVIALTPGSEPAQAETAALICQAVARPAGGFLEAAAAVSDDLCIMERRGDVWSLTAAVLCAPSQWSLAENIGGPLTHLHGPVPDRLGPGETQGLAVRIARVFDALPSEAILERFNWTIQAGPERFMPDGAPARAAAEAAPEEEALPLLHLRVERQTIRRLPQTGGVLFTIRVATDPLAGVFAVEGAREALTRAWRGAPNHVRAYKKWAAYERLMHAALV